MKRIFIILVLIPVFSNAQIINTFIGNGTAGYLGDGGPATAAEINGPGGLAFDNLGNTYLSDYYNNVIRKISPTGVITTIAGTGTAGYTGDGGPAAGAKINSPLQSVCDTSGNLYFPDRYNHRIRKISTSGTITTFAGNGTPGYGGDGIAATATQLYGPTGVAIDAFGNLYIADYSNYRVRKVASSGIITTVVGTGFPGSIGDGGMATDAEILNTWGITVDASGNLYLSDQGNNKIRKVTTAGIITTIAGTGTAGYSGDGGPAIAAELNNPSATAIDESGNIYISDQVNNRVREILTSGVMTTFSGNGIGSYNGDGIMASAAEINYTNELAFNPSGHLLICDNSNSRVRIINNCVNGITHNPVSDTVVSGDNAVFTVTTSVASPVYQWQEDPGTGFVDLADVLPYSGVYTNTLTIHNVIMLFNNSHYRCIISNGSSCPDTSSSAILVIHDGTGIKQLSGEGVSIYPNPTHDEITLKLPDNNKTGYLQLMNQLGQVLFQENINGNTASIDVRTLAVGVYILKLQYEDGFLCKKIIRN